ncbi:hypothetical protein R3P38DRAFT_3178688 [Favolaschia claudopus]|uniref:Uncharacterized protein n=1 Tax=Favolaschia claudopus TaxID=2862362 RepID=A0AAW0CS86_9AGAR
MSGRHYPVVVYEHLGHTYCVPRLSSAGNSLPEKGYYKLYVCSTIAEACQFWRQTCAAKHSLTTHVIRSTQDANAISHRFPCEDNDAAANDDGADGREAIKQTFTRRGERTVNHKTPEIEGHGPVPPSELPRIYLLGEDAEKRFELDANGNPTLPQTAPSMSKHVTRSSTRQPAVIGSPSHTAPPSDGEVARAPSKVCSVRTATCPYNPPAAPSQPEFTYNSRTQVVSRGHY